MAASLLTGRALADRLIAGLRGEPARLKRPPRVAAVHNAADPGVAYYMRSQKRLCAEHGIAYDLYPIEAATPPAKALALIDRLNADPAVTGITVHVPPPPGHDVEALVARVAPEKDIEATHPESLGRLVRGDTALAPCAAAAAVALAREARPSLRGLEAVVVGRSPIVGLPAAILLLRAGADAPTPTVCHTATADLAAHVRRADLVLTAAARAGTIRGSMIKPGATVVDISVNPAPGGGICGDVVLEEARAVAAHVTPVPGGVGPVTLAMLLRNILTCARRLHA
jgi:methylenetetrahydrofolate dehydrogenase (NADP+)/methenyltetrahydrofolate cyclohydrolase